MASPSLLVYTRPNCVLCGKVKELLRGAGLAFEERVVQSTAEHEALATRFGVRNFPMLVLDERYLGGFTHLVHLLSTGRLRALALGAVPSAVPPRDPA